MRVVTLDFTWSGHCHHLSVGVTEFCIQEMVINVLALAAESSRFLVIGRKFTTRKRNRLPRN